MIMLEGSAWAKHSRLRFRTSLLGRRVPPNGEIVSGYLSLVSALVESNGLLDAIKPDRTGRRQLRFPRYHAMKPAVASSITLRIADRSRSLPGETFDFLHDKRSIRPVHLQQVLRFAILHDRAASQDDDPIEIS